MRQFKPGQLQSGSLYPITASFALTASYLSGSISIDTGSLVTTASFNAFTASYTTGSFTGSFKGDGSQLTGIVSSKWTGSNPISRQSDVEITGSLRVQGSITGSLFGTASNAITASYIVTAQTASYVLQAVSASFATSASRSISSSFSSTASFAQTAQTASYILNAVSASFATSASRAVSSSFTSTASFVTPLTQDVIITGSLNVTGSSVVVNTGDFRVYDPVSVNNLLEITSLSGVQIASTDGQISADFEARTNRDSLNIDSIDWENRHLIQSDGATVTLDWETGALTGSLQGTASFAATASYVNTLRQQVLVSGSFKLDPTQDPDPSGLDLDSTVFFQSSSNTALGYDLYVRQNGNLVKWKWIEGSLETGLLYGGAVTYSGSNVFVSPGSGIIADHNAATESEVSPMIEYVTWNAITQSITNIASQQVTYLYIDNTGALQQQSTRFTSQQYHDYIPLGAVGHFDYTQVSAFGGGVQTAYDQISQISNFVDAFGPLKMSGYGLTGQPGSLRLSVGSGTSFIHGGFYQNNPEFPSQITTPSQATASLARVQRSGSAIEFDTNAGNLYTVIDPTRYDRDGDGTLANVGSGNWSIQRVFTDPKTGVLYVYYGQARYTNLLNALQYLPTDPFTEGDTFDFTTFVGFLVLKGNASNITDTANNSIINGGLFRGSGQGSGGGIALSNLDDLTDVSIVSPTNGQALVYDDAIWKNGTPLSASYALTASYLDNYVPPFPFTGSALITGSLGVTGSLSTRAQGALSTDIAFRVRNSADSADLISFRGDGSQWIQSVPFIHAGNLTGGTNTAQSLYIGYNTRGITSSGVRNVIIGTGAGSIISTNDSVCIGHNASAFNTSIAIGSNASAAANNYCVMGSESYPFSAMSIGTGGTVTSAAAVQNMIFSVGGVASGFTSNTDLSSKFFRIQSQGGSGTGNSAPIQFSVAPSGSGGFISNAFVIPLEIRGDAAGLNHYQLATPRISTSSLTDGYIQYSADRNGVAGKASPHFRTEDGTVLWLGDESRLFNVTASRTIISSSQNTISGSSLTVYGSGSAQPVFTVQGSSGELFSVTDSLTGSLFSVNDISGLPILEVFSDNTTLIGNYLDPMLITTAKVTQTNSGSFVVYSLPTASYDTAFFEYSVKSGSNARAGTIMAIQSGSSVNFTETTTLDFGSTTAISFTVVVTGSNMALTGSSTTGAWTIKSIVRGL